MLMETFGFLMAMKLGLMLDKLLGPRELRVFKGKLVHREMLDHKVHKVTRGFKGRLDLLARLAQLDQRVTRVTLVQLEQVEH
jgi:hypothetical protein